MTLGRERSLSVLRGNQIKCYLYRSGNLLGRGLGSFLRTVGKSVVRKFSDADLTPVNNPASSSPATRIADADVEAPRREGIQPGSQNWKVPAPL